VKQLNGATFSVPAWLIDTTHAIGRGTTQQVSRR
jgi:hypothetical protein